MKSFISCHMVRLLIGMIALGIHLVGYGEEAKPLAANPALEAQVMNIAAELRCLVCQNETIAGSHADLALDLRSQIRQQLISGKSKQEIMAYMVERYGDFVLYKPPVQSNTWLLWFGPFLLLVVGFIMLVRYAHNATRASEQTTDGDDLVRARDLLTIAEKEPQ